MFYRFLAAIALSVALPLSSAAETLGTVNFDFDSDTLDAEARAEITQIAGRLNENPSYKPTVVVGHTDAVGSPGYNDGLGLRRAERVAAALVAAGVPVARVGTVESRGENELLVAVSTAQRANRRVTIQLGDMLAACRSWRTINVTPASVGPELQGDLVSRLNEAVEAYQRFGSDGANGPAFQMAGAAREDCGIAVGFGDAERRKVEYAQRCLCSSARLRVALDQ